MQEDQRLQVFARFLTEEWGPPVLLAYVAAASLCVQPAGIACLEFPREAGRGGQYPWLDYIKAAWVADQVLGQRSGETRQRFLSMVRMEWQPPMERLAAAVHRCILSQGAGGCLVRALQELMVPCMQAKSALWLGQVFC